MSTSDIDRGARWQDELGRQLEECNVGIVCVTRDNVNAPWLLFEAGALSKMRASAHVCTYLFDGIEPTELSGPLSIFQMTKANRDDTLELLRTINSKLTEPVQSDILQEGFDLRWSSLEADFARAPQSDSDQLPHRRDREILEEVLTLTRDLARKIDLQRNAKNLPVAEAVGHIKRHTKGCISEYRERGVEPSSGELLSYVTKHAPRSVSTLGVKRVEQIIAEVAAQGAA
jgi:hypothetical protein